MRRAHILVAAAVLAFSGSANAHIATISGGYDLNEYDTPELLFNNTSSYDFTGAQMVLTGYQGINNGVSQTVSLGTILAGTTLDNIWNGPGPLMAYDYDDTAGGTAPCPPNPINSGLCGDPGNFYVTFTATLSGAGGLNGDTIFSVFSPAVNATGGFVPWEGLNAAGISEDPCCDLHSGSVTGTLAYIDLGLPPPYQTPEPLTLSLFGAGLAGAAAIRRRRKTN